ncbi:hypothetical protein [Burkholderia sp. IMCC1007]|uniref:hypothetical protein n=1 Tax=Burkholderia sp. IMCC1007 TaxID=3004104 RepID=UPI0022B309ED|nr:hypothetical protein [Burkholderia sp. IMCC1007]
MLCITSAFLIASASSYAGEVTSNDFKRLLPSRSHTRSEIRIVGECQFTVENESDAVEYRIDYGKEEYATYVTQPLDVRPAITITLTIGCASGENEDVDGAMGANENIVKSSQDGKWSLSKKGIQQTEPRLDVTNIVNGATRGYVLIATSDVMPSQNNVAFCVTDQQQVLCGGAVLSAPLLQERTRNSVVNLIRGIKLVPFPRPSTKLTIPMGPAIATRCSLRNVGATSGNAFLEQLTSMAPRA